MSIGLTMDDIKKMDVGIMLDLITSKSNMYIKEKKKQESKQENKQKKKGWREATQVDFDLL
jgi:hypothetical protein